MLSASCPIVAAIGHFWEHHGHEDPADPTLIAERSCEHLRLVGVISHAHPIIERQACVHNVHANVDVQLDSLSVFGQPRKCAECLLQVSNGLAIGAPLYGPEPRLSEIGNCLLP